MQNKLSLYNLFESHLYGSSNIIYCDEIEKHSITFSELQNEVYLISEYLENLLLSKSVICCLIKPSVAVPAVILGILKISSTFAFLDIYKPFQSLLAFQKHLEVKALLIEKCYLKNLEVLLCHCWKKSKEFFFFTNFIILQPTACEDINCANIKQYRKCNWQSKIAYAVQTSGTTGEPKTVQVPHDCITSNLVDFRSRFCVTADDVILQSTRITFDPSIIEIFLSLSTGATLIIIPEYVRSTPKKLAEILVSNNVTILQGTPSLILNFGEKFLTEILFNEGSVLRVLAFGGESCPSVNKLKKWKCEGNKTEIYNLYGLTEVSCWASCFKIDFNIRDMSLNVPIGEPLLNTKFEILNEEKIISEKGQLYVGGHRFCIVNDEEWPENSASFMRPTGDFVYKATNGFIYFEGRNDSIIKYMGHKISLHFINNIINNFSEVQHHFLHFEFSSNKLFLFVVWSSKNYCKTEIEKQLLECVKSVSNLPPVIIYPVPFIPVTNHGKVDAKKLINFVSSRKKRTYSAEKHIAEDYLDFIATLWKNYTNQLIINENDSFILQGGNSISAVQFSSEIEWHFQLSLPLLVEKILNESFRDVCDYVKLCLKNDDQFVPLNEHSSDFVESTSEPLSKKKYLKKLQCFKTYFKQGCFEYCMHTIDSKNCFYSKSNCSQSGELHLNLSFTWDMKKCIDATPCILYLPMLNEFLIFIGSHFGMFCCIDVNKKIEKWQVLVPDRIESSATVSACGNYVLFGCYDHNLYCINIINGSTHWKHTTGAEVKSSPSISLNNTVFVGSHDKHVHAIDVESGFVLWKKQVSYGAIFSSPTVIEKLSAICVGALDGVLALLKIETGDILWKHKSGKPLFSSPLITSNCILIGSTDNCMLCLDFNGKVKFRYSTDGPVFSSCAYNQEFNNNEVAFSCHDSYLYCITLNGELIWKALCDSVVYATPFLFQWNDCSYICVGSSAGTIYIFQLSNGKVILSWKCPREIFSSPIVLNDTLVIGCRDNNVYCFNLQSFIDNTE